MVSSLIKKLRNVIPLFGITALLAMFVKLPEVPSIFGIFKCTSCSPTSPYLSLFAGGYFSVLIAVSLLFPSFPGQSVARGGMVWSLLLLVILTYLNLPDWCIPCLLAHGCNVMIWTIWLFAPEEKENPLASPVKERLFLLLFTPILTAALFGSLNLTFLIYGLKQNRTIPTPSLKGGDFVPAFTAKNYNGHPIAEIGTQAEITLINFIAPGCTFCKEQLEVLSAFAHASAAGSIRIINVSPALTPDFIELLPAAEWIEDKEGKLRQLFKVEGYPMLFISGKDGKLIEVIPGVSEKLKTTLTQLQSI